MVRPWQLANNHCSTAGCTALNAGASLGGDAGGGAAWQRRCQLAERPSAGAAGQRGPLLSIA